MLPITTSNNIANKVNSEIIKFVSVIPRKEIIYSSLKENGFISVGKLSDAIALANKIAPEHIQIMTKNPYEISKKINSAGLVRSEEHTSELQSH